MNLETLQRVVAETTFEHRKHRLQDLKDNPTKENASDFLIELASEHPEYTATMEAILKDLVDDRIDVPRAVKLAVEAMQKWRQIARKEAPKVAAKVEKEALKNLRRLRSSDPYLYERATEVGRLMHTATIDLVEDPAASVWSYRTSPLGESGYLTAFGDVHAVGVRVMLAQDRSRFRRWRYTVAADVEPLSTYGDPKPRPHTLRINSPNPSHRKLVDLG